MIVYVDVLFIQNFLIDFILILLTMQTLKLNPNFLNITIASLVGAIYVFTKLFSFVEVFSTWPFQIIIAALIMFISIRKRSKSYLIKSTIIFIAYSMLISGACYYISTTSNGSLMNISYKNIIITFIIIYLLSYRIVVFYKERSINKELTYEILVHIKDETFSIRGFLDTGNELREPVSNLPVIIVERGVLNGIKLNKNDLIYIPFSVVNFSNQKMSGFKADSIEIIKSRDNIEVKKNVITKAVVGISENSLSEYGEYNAILPKEFIECLF